MTNEFQKKSSILATQGAAKLPDVKIDGFKKKKNDFREACDIFLVIDYKYVLNSMCKTIFLGPSTLTPVNFTAF